MLVITFFSALSFTACAFLIYVLGHFHRELVLSGTIRRRCAEELSLVYIGSYEKRSPLPLVMPSRSATRTEGTRQEMLVEHFGYGHDSR
jgi:hypothetical protein